MVMPGDEKTFIQGLAGGLIIVAVLVLAFGGSAVGYSPAGIFGSSGWPGAGPAMPELVAADFATAVPVGRIVAERVEERPLGDFAVYGSPAEASYPGGEVFSGLLFGTRSLRYKANSPESLYVKIDDTNSYGPFMVKVNGETAFSRILPAGEHTIPIGVEGPAEMEISAESSYWKLWAPSLYRLSEVRIKSSENARSYEFDGTDAVSGELVIGLDESNGKGDLRATLNGRQIFGEMAEGSLSIGLDGLVSGPNRLTIEAAPRASYAGSATLRIVRAEREDRAAELRFNLTKAQAGKLPGHIIFEIPEVMHKGRVSVRLIVSGQAKLAESFEAKPGTQAVAIFPANAVPGEIHTVLIEGAEGAAFTIRNLKVRV